jgi:hypothetical protein
MSNEIKIATTTDDTESLLHAAGRGAQLTEASETQPQSEERRAEAERGEPDAQQERDGRPRSAYQKRIDKIIRERGQARQEAEALRARLAQYEQANGRGQVSAQANTNGNGSQPEARQAEWQESQVETEAQRIERENRDFQQAMHQIGQPMSQRLAQNPEKKAALNAAVARAIENGRDIPRPACVAAIDAPNAEDVLQYVLDNEEVLAKLWKMQPQRQFEAIHRISLDLDLNPPERESEPANRAPTRTPPAPIRPVGNSGARASITSADVDDLNYQEYKQARDAGRIGMSAKQRRERGIT